MLSKPSSRWREWILAILLAAPIILLAWGAVWWLLP
jgi:hypothetical protein